MSYRICTKDGCMSARYESMEAAQEAMEKVVADCQEWNNKMAEPGEKPVDAAEYFWIGVDNG